MLLLASGLDGPGWKICLLLVIASLVVMCIGQQIKKVRWAATRVRTQQNKYIFIVRYAKEKSQDEK
nr:MAG TPA: hypothetical protein [Caudoviricetes sp.]